MKKLGITDSFATKVQVMLQKKEIPQSEYLS